MESNFETFLLSELGIGEVYDLLTATVSPRPIGFVSTLNREGAPNVAPFSFFTLGGANPPSLVFSAVLQQDGSTKETQRNIEESGEFVVNTVHRAMVPGINRADRKSVV